MTLTRVASRIAIAFGKAESRPEQPGDGFRAVVLALVLLSALSVIGIAIALGEAQPRRCAFGRAGRHHTLIHNWRL